MKYIERIKLAKSIRKELDSNRFTTRCFSAKADDRTPSGLATEDCDIAIDFQNPEKRDIGDVRAFIEGAGLTIVEIVSLSGSLQRLKLKE